MDTDPSMAVSRSDLERELDRIKVEIADYPVPVAGCDAQFNHLLDKRRRILEELNQPESAEV